MAGGYATSRPRVHPHIIERVFAHLRRAEPFERVLDVGCGAGLSTQAIAPFARHIIGLDPVEAMLRWASAAVPSARFVAGRAEALPFRDRTVDLITAAGSLNYVNLDRFFAEALRVLVPHGHVVAYDFSPGSHFRHAAGLAEWFGAFLQRYPAAPGEARALDPEILAALHPAFQLRCQERFEIGLPLTREFYLEYMMTETNVAAAVRAGTSHAEIEAWCHETLSRCWKTGEREVLFRGYFACLSRA